MLRRGLSLRLSSRRGCWSLLGGSGSTGSAAGILDVVPGDVEEDGLRGDQGQLGRVGDDVGEVDAVGGVLVEALDEGGLDDVVGGAALLAEVFDVDDGAMALEFAVEEGLEERGGLGGDFDVEGCVFGNVSCVRKG